MMIRLHSGLAHIRLVTLVIVTLGLMLALTVGAEPAHADRCQPEELVTGSGSSPIPESADPTCPVIDEDNAVRDTAVTTFDFVFFVTGPLDAYAVHDAACRAIGGTPGRQGKIPVCYEGDPL